MSEKVIWLLAFTALYWTFCVYWGLRGAMEARSASDYFIAGRRLPMAVFVLAVPGALVAGWTFYGYPAGIGRYGFPYAYVALFAVVAAIAGAMLQKRQWMLSKRYGYLTPGEMLGDYFQSGAIPLLTAFVALVFAVGFLGLLLWTSGYLLSTLTDSYFSETTAMWTAAAVLFLYVALGGLRAAAYAGVLQFALYVFGVVAIGTIALDAAGGWGQVNAALANLAAADGGTPGTVQGWSGADHNAYFALHSVIHPVPDGPAGVVWTGVVCLTFLFALVGIQTSPAFSIATFASRDEKAFGTQQGAILAFLIGLLLLTFGLFQGLGAFALHGDAGGVAAAEAISVPVVMPVPPGAFVLAYLEAVADSAPWLFGILAVCGLAAMQSTAALFLSAGSAVLTRDVYKRLIDPAASNTRQQAAGRAGALTIVLAALGVASSGPAALPLFAGFAIACGLQMLPSLVAICWIPRISGQGAVAGFSAGLVAVFLTDPLGAHIAGALGLELPGGRLPIVLHSAVWGIAVNVAVCLLVSALTRGNAARERRLAFHEFLQHHARLPATKRRLVPVAWIAVLAWMFFAVGPGAVVGNEIFGAPDGAAGGWTFGIPSIWAWQILFWLIGVALVWALASKMELSTPARDPVKALVEDYGDAPKGRTAG